MIQLSHRGIGTGYPENSLAAFKAALASNLDGIELDVRCCKSGEAIVIHDRSVDRTTDGAGLVRDLTLEQLQDLHLDDGSAPPTLEQVLKIAKGKLVDIELKDVASSEPVAKLIAQYPKVDFVVTSKLGWALEAFRKFDTQTDVGYVSSWRPFPPKKLIEKVNATHMVWNSRMITWWGVRSAKKQNLMTFAYKVRAPLIASILDYHRIEGIIVDTEQAIEIKPER